jgi:hypothetical protein
MNVEEIAVAWFGDDHDPETGGGLTFKFVRVGVWGETAEEEVAFLGSIPR